MKVPSSSRNSLFLKNVFNKRVYVECNIEAYAETTNVDLAAFRTTVYLSRCRFVLDDVQM